MPTLSPSVGERNASKARPERAPMFDANVLHAGQSATDVG